MLQNFGHWNTKIYGLILVISILLTNTSAKISTPGPHYLPAETPSTTTTTTTTTTGTFSTSPITSKTTKIIISTSTRGPPYLPISKITTIRPIQQYSTYTPRTYKYNPVTFKYNFTPGNFVDYKTPIYSVNFTRGSTTTTKRYRPSIDDNNVNLIKYFK
jgi:hypothetical protein